MMTTGAEVHARANNLLRGHLSPEQLAQFETSRATMQPFASMHPDIAEKIRWFNLDGSLGGRYTVSGIAGGVVDQGWGASVGLGYDNPGCDWCVKVYSWHGPHEYRTMPIGDQMLAFKLALEVDEAGFLFRSVPTSRMAQILRDHHQVAIMAAHEAMAV